MTGDDRLSDGIGERDREIDVARGIGILGAGRAGAAERNAEFERREIGDIHGLVLVRGIDLEEPARSRPRYRCGALGRVVIAASCAMRVLRQARMVVRYAFGRRARRLVEIVDDEIVNRRAVRENSRGHSA